MGYTHYWTFDPNKIEDKKLLQEKFLKASSKIKEFAAYLDRNKLVTICGGLGKYEPLFTKDEIWFNGCLDEKLDHETFSIQCKSPNLVRGFCKTARKPYDVLVCFSLLTFADMFPEEAFTYSTDGNMTETGWQIAMDYYKAFTPHGSKSSGFYPL